MTRPLPHRLAGILPLLSAALLAAAAPDRAVIREETVQRDVVRVRDGKRTPAGRETFPAIVLENRHLRVIVCPRLGERILNVVDKATGRRCLYEGPLLILGTAYTEGGGSGGGLHVNHPLYHAGSSYVIPLPHAARIEEDGTAVLTLSHESYPHLQRTTWQVRLRPGEAAFRCRYRFENLAPYPMGFNPWINCAFPMADDARFTLPADWIAGHWFGINPVGGDGDYGHHLKPWPVGTNGLDQSFVSNRQWSAAFAYGLKGGYAGIHYGRSDAGFAHVFDPVVMSGAKAAGAWSTNGWLEVWGAFSHNMEDPLWLGPHEVVEAEDLWFPFRGTGGLTWANENGALFLESRGGRLACGVHLLREGGKAALRVSADGVPVYESPVERSPARPFFRLLEAPAGADAVRVQVRDETGRSLLDHTVVLGPRPASRFDLTAGPWHKRSPVAEALWQEAFTPLMGWGPWFHPPTSFSKALAAAPADPEAALGLARCWIKEADANLFRGRPTTVTAETRYAEAEALLEKMAAAKAPDPRVLDLLALVQLRTGRREPARGTISKRLEAGGESATVRYRLALLAAGDGNWRQAALEARAALDRAPEASLPRLLLGLAQIRQERIEQARATLKPLLEADPTDLRARLLLKRAGEPEPNAAELERMAANSPIQYKAAEAAVAALEKGADLDPLAVDTTRE